MKLAWRDPSDVVPGLMLPYVCAMCPDVHGSQTADCCGRGGKQQNNNLYCILKPLFKDTI